MQLSLFDTLYGPVEIRDKQDEMIEKVLMLGSGVEDGKKRIYDFAVTNPSIQSFAKMLQEEYGTGGRACNGNEITYEMHDGSGITFRWMEIGEEVETSITWKEAAEVILDLVERGIYFLREKDAG